MPATSRQGAARPLAVPEIVSMPVELDMTVSDAAVADLQAAIQPGVPVVIADMGRTEFCDCAGLRCLSVAGEQAAACGAELRVVVGSANVRRLLSLVGAEKLLQIYPDMTAALSGAPRAGPPAGQPGAAAGAPDSEDAGDAAATDAPNLHQRCHTAIETAQDLMEQAGTSGADPDQQRAHARADLLRVSRFARLYSRAATMPAIEQAKGILMYHEHCSADVAFDLLRRASQRSNMPVRQIAADIVARTARRPQDGDGAGAQMGDL